MTTVVMTVMGYESFDEYVHRIFHFEKKILSHCENLMKCDFIMNNLLIDFNNNKNINPNEPFHQFITKPNNKVMYDWIWDVIHRQFMEDSNYFYDNAISFVLDDFRAGVNQSNPYLTHFDSYVKYITLEEFVVHVGKINNLMMELHLVLNEYYKTLVKHLHREIYTRDLKFALEHTIKINTYLDISNDRYDELVRKHGINISKKVVG